MTSLPGVDRGDISALFFCQHMPSYTHHIFWLPLEALAGNKLDCWQSYVEPERKQYRGQVSLSVKEFTNKVQLLKTSYL